MPGFDGTGPLGQGPRTGGGFGLCGTGVGRGNNAGYANRGAGRGLPPWGGGRGRCFGGGRGGFGRGYQRYAGPEIQTPAFTAAPAVQETEFLRNQAASLERELAAVKQRLNALELNAQK